MEEDSSEEPTMEVAKEEYHFVADEGNLLAVRCVLQFECEEEEQ